jgi:uncharacterized protein (DUF58 family)
MSTRWIYLILISLLVLSVWSRSPWLILLTALLALAVVASAVWAQYCLAEVRYARYFGADRLEFGEETDLWIEIVNAKPLPLAWLKVEDEFPVALAIRDTALGYTGNPHRRALLQLLSLRWYERVRRHYRLVGTKRGAYEFGPVQLASGDLFGLRTRTLELAASQSLLVYPRVLPLAELRLTPARPFGEGRAARRILTDPLRLAGARDYHSGDNPRHIHWKATARRGLLQTKVFDSSADPYLVIALNSQTREHIYDGVVGDLFERGAMVAASVAVATLEAGRSVGFMTNGGVSGSDRRVRLPATRHRSQVTRILETLAQLTYYTQLPFETLIESEIHDLPYGATVLVITALFTEPIAAALLALRSAGHPVAVIETGPPGAIDLPPDIALYSMDEDWERRETAIA